MSHGRSRPMTGCVGSDFDSSGFWHNRQGLADDHDWELCDKHDRDRSSVHLQDFNVDNPGTSSRTVLSLASSSTSGQPAVSSNEWNSMLTPAFSSTMDMSKSLALPWEEGTFKDSFCQRPSTLLL